MEVGRKQMEGLTPDSTLRDAAERTLRARLGAVMDRLAPAAAGGPESPGHVHKLRVATRKAGAALDLFEECVRGKDLKRVRKRLRSIRRAAGGVRDMDVLGALLQRMRKKAQPEIGEALDFLLGRVAERRAEGEARLTRVAEQLPRSELRAGRKRLIKNLREVKAGGGEGPVRFADAGRTALTAMLADLKAAGEADLTDLENLHAARLTGKRLRYATEMYGGCFDAHLTRDLLPRLEEMQESLGAINDSHQVVGFLEEILGGDDEGQSEDAPKRSPLEPVLRASIERLLARWRDQREDRRGGFVEWWEGLRASGFFAQFERAIASGAALPNLSAPQQRIGQPAEPHVNGAATIAPAPAQPGDGGVRPWRIAAIDVGTNSIRLIVAEAFGDGNYRVLDDEREIARLGKGMTDGALSAEAIERAVLVIDHMRRIAEGYGVERLRAVGTAAVREARNGEEFARLLRERTGLSLEIIDSEQEAKLAYISAAHAFDLRSLPAAVVDIGGGSTEIVLSSGPVIEQVYAVPLGAVRLTERFGGGEKASGKRFKEMRRFVKREVRDKVKDLPFTPQLLVGSGGTFEALAKVAMQQRGARGVSATVRGYDMSIDEVSELLETLRDMPLRERLRVPGLSEQRAEIIVAGACVVQRVMKRLGVERMRVNDGGIRDGMLLTMIGEFFAGPEAEEAPAPQPGREPRSRAQMRSVRHFAAACNYERRHCYHVASLCLQIYDQLLRDPALVAAADASCGPAWREPDARLLLEAAGVLHDCGYHINYARHHLHSYHLIMHSDMAGFTRREIEIVANVGRYHRGPEPKGKRENLADLPRADRNLVRTLSAILRVADGLDRTHMQNVRGIRLERPAPDNGSRAPLRLELDAPADPAVDVWGSQRKSGLFHEVFGVELEYAWRGAPAIPSAPSDGEGPPAAAQAPSRTANA